MSEEIKEFFNDAVSAGITQAVVTNDATTKAFIKDIYVTSKDYPTEVDLVVGGNTIYSSVSVAAGETVKFQQENIIVPKGSVMEFINNALVYGAAWTQTGAASTNGSSYLTNCILGNGDLVTVYRDSDSPFYWQFEVRKPDGTFIASGPMLSENGSQPFCVATLDSDGIHRCVVLYQGVSAHIHLGNVFQSGDTYKYANGGESTTYNNNYQSICGLSGNTKSFFSMANQTNNGMIVAVCSAEGSRTYINQDFNTNSACSYTDNCQLSNGNALVAWRDSTNGRADFAIWGPDSITPVVGITQFRDEGSTHIHPVGFDNGTFGVFANAVGTNDIEFTLFNNDGTLNTAMKVVDNGSSYSYRDVHNGPNDTALYTYQDKLVKYIATYDNTGTLLSKVKYDLQTTAVPTIDIAKATGDQFCSWGNLVVHTEYRPVDAPFNVKVDGVEVIDD